MSIRFLVYDTINNLHLFLKKYLHEHETVNAKGRRGWGECETRRQISRPPRSAQPKRTLTMTASAIALAPLSNRLVSVPAGQFVGVSWSRPMKTRKGVTDTLTKSVRSTVMVGANYDNRECVQDARANGDAPAENAGLPWGNWVEGLENRVIENKGKFYLRIYPVKNADGTRRACKTIFRRNGEIVPKASLQALCLASEFAESKPHTCYTLEEVNLCAVRSVRRSDAKVNLLGKA